MIDRRPIFEAVRQLRAGKGFTLAEVKILDAGIDRAIAGIANNDPAQRGITENLLKEMNSIAAERAAEAGAAAAAAAKPAPSPIVSHLSLTARVALEIVGHEAIVLEAYKDSVGVWTWGIGVTSRSGHKVYPRYKDNPQPIARVLEVFLWLLREKYIPDVIKALKGFVLSEAQFAAALSFHYNTGAILKASWVKSVKAGDMLSARRQIMDWTKNKELAERRKKERDLFFDGEWSQDGKAMVWPVRKPSYTPDWRRGKRVDITTALRSLL